jgi:hypothetical protein
MVLRKGTKGLVLVGDAYVHGLIEREFAQILEGRKLAIQEFVI